MQVDGSTAVNNCVKCSVENFMAANLLSSLALRQQEPSGAHSTPLTKFVLGQAAAASAITWSQVIIQSTVYRNLMQRNCFLEPSECRCHTCKRLPCASYCCWGCVKRA
jgi:hypothetical protein